MVRRRVLVVGCAVLVLGALAGPPRAQALRAVPGSLDRSFGGDGRVVSIFGDDSVVLALAMQGGKVIAAGDTAVVGGSNGALERLRGDGRLDRSFGKRGRVTVRSAGYAQLSDLAVLPNGKILAVGRLGDRFCVLRFTRDGVRDHTFGGGDGLVVTDFGQDGASSAQVALVRHGRFVAVGTSHLNDGVATTTSLALARYRPNGRLDPTFSGDGRVLTTFSASPGETDAVAQLLHRGTGDKVVLVGTEQGPADTGSHVSLAAYTGRGRLDRSFGGGDGKVVQSVGVDDSVSGAVMTPAGSIIATGHTDPGSGNVAMLVKVTSAGTPAYPFGGGHGFATPDIGTSDQYWFAAAQSGREVLLAGKVAGHAAVMRLTAAGRLDTSFSGDGWRQVRFGAESDFEAVTVQPDGRIVAGGWSLGTRTSGEMVLARLHS